MVLDFVFDEIVEYVGGITQYGSIYPFTIPNGATLTSLTIDGGYPELTNAFPSTPPISTPLGLQFVYYNGVAPIDPNAVTSTTYMELHQGNITDPMDLRYKPGLPSGGYWLPNPQYLAPGLYSLEFTLTANYDNGSTFPLKVRANVDLGPIL